jgi:hypothetical protein
MLQLCLPNALFVISDASKSLNTYFSLNDAVYGWRKHWIGPSALDLQARSQRRNLKPPYLLQPESPEAKLQAERSLTHVVLFRRRSEGRERRSNTTALRIRAADSDAC